MQISKNLYIDSGT